MGRDGFSLILASIFSVPLLINVVANQMGFFLFPAGDPVLQLGYTTAVLVAAWPIHAGAVKQARTLKPGLLLIVSSTALVLYAASVYYVVTGAAIPPFPSDIWFDTVALLLLAALTAEMVRHLRPQRV